MFNFFKKRKPEPPKVDPEWQRIQEEYQERRQREMILLHRLQMNRYRSADMQRHLAQQAQTSSSRHENALVLVQQQPRHTTSALNLPAVKRAIQQFRPIRYAYRDKRADESIFQFFNRCLWHFSQTTGQWPNTIYHPLLSALSEYDQALFTMLDDPFLFPSGYGVFRLVADRRLVGQIILEAL